MKNPGCGVQPGFDCRLRETVVMQGANDLQPAFWNGIHRVVGLVRSTTCFADSRFEARGGRMLLRIAENNRIVKDVGCLRIVISRRALRATLVQRLRRRFFIAPLSGSGHAASSGGWHPDSPAAPADEQKQAFQGVATGSGAHRPLG